ncbi:hypothetical protein AC1031_016169 [Aphanomyces cochlioides]|nr:hypothetical protein AC1031_016169 [Aphanomyces cochlioides]
MIARRTLIKLLRPVAQTRSFGHAFSARQNKPMSFALSGLLGVGILGCTILQDDSSVASNDTLNAHLKTASLAKVNIPSKIAALAKDPKFVNMGEELFDTVPISDVEKNYVHSLHRKGKIEAFQVFGDVDRTKTTTLIHFGEELCGHKGIVHGGCIATVFDELFGWTMYWTSDKVGFTANLSVNYRKPLLAETSGIVHVEIDKLEGRKLYLKARLEDNDGVHYADATALFILPRDTA